MEFYRKYVPVDVNDLVTLCNVPMASRPYGKRYRIRFTANVAEAGDMEFVNVPLNVFKKAAVDQISAGHPIWFACDCTQFSLRGAGYFDCRHRARRPAVRHRVHLRQGPRGSNTATARGQPRR